MTSLMGGCLDRRHQHPPALARQADVAWIGLEFVKDFCHRGSEQGCCMLPGEGGELYAGVCVGGDFIDALTPSLTHADPHTHTRTGTPHTVKHTDMRGSPCGS